VSDNLARIAEERDALATLLERTIADLRDGHYDSLATFVTREQEARARLQAVAAKEEETTREVESLAATLKEEEDKHHGEMEAKRAEVAALKERLRKLKVDTTAALRYARKEASARTEAVARLFSADEGELMAAIDAVRKQMDVENAVHEATVETLRREQEELARQADEWKVTHAAEREAADAKLRALQAEREAQVAALSALQERYDKELAELAEVEADEERRREAERAQAVEEARRRQAAIQIQKVVGDMFSLVRAVRANAADGKKKKGKDGGKKKKK
jgi:hypothetical protein